jgi:hypothetical protein
MDRRVMHLGYRWESQNERKNSRKTKEEVGGYRVGQTQLGSF